MYSKKLNNKRKIKTHKVKSYYTPELEWHYNDVTQTNSDVVTTGKVHIDTIFNGLVQGTDAVNRLGQSIRLKRLEVRCILSQQEGTGNDKEDENVDLFRLTIVLDRQTNGTAVLYTDVFKTAAIHSPINFDNIQRFQILYSKVHKVRSYGNIQATTITPKWDRDYNYFEVLLDLDDIVQFKGNTGLIGDLSSTNIAILGIGANLNNVKAQLDQKTRIYFEDN